MDTKPDDLPSKVMVVSRLCVDLVIMIGYCVVFVAAILYYIFFFLSPKSVRQKAYFARVHLLMILVGFITLLTILTFPASLLTMIHGSLMCDVFEVDPYGLCSWRTGIVYILITIYRARVYPYLGSLVLYSFVGYSLTTSIFLFRVQFSRSTDTIISLGRPRLLLVPLWEHAAAISLGVFVAFCRLIITTTMEVTYVVFGLNIILVFDLLSVAFRLLVLSFISIVECVIFVLVVINMLRSRKSSKLRANYLALLFAFVGPFSVDILANILVCICVVLWSIAISSDASNLWLEVWRTLLFVCYNAGSASFVGQFAAIACFHTFMIRRYAHRQVAVENAMKRRRELALGSGVEDYRV